MVDAGISIAELLASSVPLEWYEAVAITQGLCDTLGKWGDEMGRVRIQADTVFLSAAGSVNVTTGKSSTGPTPLQQIAELLRALLADKAIPTPLRLAVTQASVSSSVEEWSKMVAYYERPNRADLIRAVYARTVNLSASASPNIPSAGSSTVDQAPGVSPPAVVSSRRPWKFPRLNSRHEIGRAHV